jgi:hypothetical protein
MTPRKTVYIADKDMAVWRRAEELAGTSISALLAKLLRDYVASVEPLQPLEEVLEKLKSQIEKLERNEASPESRKKFRAMMKKAIDDARARPLIKGQASTEKPKPTRRKR